MKTADKQFNIADKQFKISENEFKILVTDNLKLPTTKIEINERQFRNNFDKKQPKEIMSSNW